MQIGLRLPQTGINQATKENIVHLAKQAEYAGFHSLWVLERLLWPINPQSLILEPKMVSFLLIGSTSLTQLKHSPLWLQIQLKLH
jgi:alkanesulfonate monooxygenase SsuD/methylene tetrahydromethanopterin reductase-like flavin-dependent oxidoreductase (luciferase family)